MANIFHQKYFPPESNNLRRWDQRMVTRLNRLELTMSRVAGRNSLHSNPTHRFVNHQRVSRVSNYSVPVNVSNHSKLGFTFKSFWIILGTIGFLIHAYETTVKYVRYDTATLVSISLPEKIEPPALSICTLLLSKIDTNLIDPELSEKFKQNRCNEMFITDLNKCTFLYDNYSMADLMNEYSTKFAVITSNTLIDTETYYHKPNCKCVKLTRELPNNDTFLTAGDMDQMKVYPGRVIYDLISTSRPSMIGLTVHNPTTLSHSREGKMYFFLLGNETYLHWLDYDEIETEYLKYPFHSHCVSYDRNRYESRGDCIERCYETVYKNKYGKNNGIIVTTKYDEINISSIFNTFKYDRNIDKVCSMKCHLNCTTKEYFIQSSGIFPAIWIPKETIGANEEAVFTVGIFSARPRTNVKLVPSFDLNSFVIFLASIGGLWLGSSMIGTGFHLFDFIKEIFPMAKNFVKNFCAHV